MTYKNGIKEYSLMTVLFGVPMGILFGLSKFSLIVGVISGVFSGLLFTLSLFVFIKIQEKKFEKKRVEIAQEREVICDGGATLNGNGGWIFLTENGIEFYPHKINFSTDELMIPIDMIEGVRTNKNQIVLSIVDQPPIAIIVSHNKEWKKQIEAVTVGISQE